jgi:hypothetical protein
MLLAVVWHYWIGVALVIGALLTLIALLAGYLHRVEAARYRRVGRQRA